MNTYKKSLKLLDFKTRTHGTINCAKFAKNNSPYIIAGDSRNYTHIFTSNTSMPVFSFGGQQPGENTDYITAVEFWEDSTKAFSGTFRGVITIIDITTKKMTAKLLGHGTRINCMTSSKSDEIGADILVSGSADTSIKVWDINQKKCIMTMKSHRAQVNDVKISPDGSWIASCGDDKRILIWEIKTGGVVKEFDYHSAQVTCLSFNPQELALACGGAEKFSTYYCLEGSGTKILGKTKKETHTIEKLQFDEEGQFLFTAFENCLKVSSIEEGCREVGIFETKWKGVKDLKMSSNNTQLFGLAAHGNDFSLWMTEWKAASPISPATYDTKVMNQNKNLYNVGHPVKKKVINSRAINPSSLKQVEDDLRASRQPNSLSLDMIGKIRKEHKKFIDLMVDKQNYLKPIIHWLNSGNVAASVNAIEKLEDASVIMDLLNMVLNTGKINNVSIEFATTLIKKARILASSNYMIHIRIGLKFVLKCIEKYSKEITNAKAVPIMKNVDLQREERLKKMDVFLYELKEILRSKRLKKIRDRYTNEEVGRLCKVCFTDIDFLLKKTLTN